MAYRAAYWARISALMRERDAREARIGEGDFVGALGFKPKVTDEREREEFYLPAPDTTKPGGGRVWCF